MLREGLRPSVAGDDPTERQRFGTRGSARAASRARVRSKGAALAAILGVLALIGAGCGGSSSATTTATGKLASATPGTTATTTPAATATTTPASESGLSGQWKGQYGGAYNGTFVLRWQQSGSSLSGKITISSPLSTLDVNGTLHGSAITFGTVGSLAITYTGTVSGSSMSGSYRTPGGGGSWSASRS